MPIPKPKDGETQDEFMKRCMSDETMIGEFPDEKQRYAVCMTQFKGGSEKKMKPAQKEIRLAEIRALEPVQDNENEMIVEGRAIVYDSPTVMYEIDGVKYYEVIQRGALEGADLKDVPFKYNHSDSVMIMARTRNKTLELIPDDQGLLIRAKLANTTTGRDLYELIKRGDIDKMSFAFTVAEDSYDKETRTRVIKRFKKIWDVSAVDTPAYQDTYISARSFFEAQAEAERQAAEAAEELRKRLIIKTYLF
ncbi:HK97 family phage prohead protease [Thermoclostridium stercorarium]|nr:HK97 family phage prohead protease [Thermoclostridium stercorarium]